MIQCDCISDTVVMNDGYDHYDDENEYDDDDDENVYS